MFVSREHHPQLLSPELYYSAGQFERERSRLFLPAWHCVGVLDEWPRDGVYRTLDLLGNPLVLWRQRGEVHAYLNVCAHRAATLTGRACGHAERLKCQYHGWEYDETGNVRKMPDARAFRPLAPGMLGLKRFHAARCGQLVFVSLAENPPSLQDHLGPGYDLIQSWFTPELRTAVVSQRDIDANWKVLVENALETYHTTEVHPRTFGPFPDEESCTHELADRWTSLTVSYEQERSLRRWLDDLGHRLVRVMPSHQYQHVLYYPNLMLSSLSLYRWFECVTPLSPTRARSTVRVLCHAGRGAGPIARWNAFWIKHWARTFLMRVGREDEAVLSEVQRGLEAVDRPMGGLISTREERVYHFQRYIEAHLNDGSRPPEAEVDNGHSAGHSSPRGESAISRPNYQANVPRA